MSKPTTALLAVCLLATLVACEPRPQNPHARQAVENCLAGMKQAAHGMSPASKFVVLAGACKDLYVEDGCRKAFADIGAVPPDRRATIIAQSCSRAYCSKLAKPLPEICSKDALPANPMLLIPLWQELQWAILSRDLGSRLASRLYPRLILAQLAMRPIFISTPLQVELPRSKAPEATPSPLTP